MQKVVDYNNVLKAIIIIINVYLMVNIDKSTGGYRCG